MLSFHRQKVITSLRSIHRNSTNVITVSTRTFAAPSFATLDVDKWNGKNVHVQKNLGL